MRLNSQSRLLMLFRGVDAVRRIILNLIFWIIIILVIAFWLASRPPRVRQNTVLKLAPKGILTEFEGQAYQKWLNGNYSGMLLDDLIIAVRAGQNDKRIQGIWLDLHSLVYAGPAVAGELADTIKKFSSSGKPVIASSDNYDTTGYRIASASSHIVLDRMGEVFPTGYGEWTPYFAEGLEKLGADVRLFRTGESKSAADSFIRNDLSETSRREKISLYGDLWETWLSAVAANRGLNPDHLNSWISGYDQQLLAVSGNPSEAAMKALLIDEVETGGVLKRRLDAVFGKDARFVDALDYRAGLKQPRNSKIIAVVPISGILVNGTSTLNEVGSSDVLTVLESVKSIPKIAAVVLRIDSPGGDAQAAEDIRRSVQELRETLPVVVSMGNYAASGGYWIAVESDAIIARPETITGSIGVYSFSVTFEKGLAELLGINIDGIGTTPWSEMGNIGRTMNDRMAAIYNAGIMDVDTFFRNLVAEKRGLTSDELNTASGGMGWSGRQALNLGLIDIQGDLMDAVTHAAQLAGLDKWQVRRMTPPKDFLDSLQSFIDEKIFILLTR